MRLDSSAARSPACWIAGPLDSRSGRPLSCATIIASVVLPSPGGPDSRMWSAGRCWMRAASSSSCSCPRTFCWPTNSASEVGRSAPSIASSVSSTGSSASRSSSTDGLLARGAEGRRASGAAARAPTARSASRRVGGDATRAPRRRCARTSRGRRAPGRPAPTTAGAASRAATARGRGACDLAGELHDDELRRLRADARDAAERRVVVGGDGVGDLGDA